MEDQPGKMTDKQKKAMYWTLVLFPPVGIFMVWHHKPWGDKKMKIVSGLSAFWLLIAIAMFTQRGGKIKTEKEKDAAVSKDTTVVASKKAATKPRKSWFKKGKKRPKKAMKAPPKKPEPKAPVVVEKPHSVLRVQVFRDIDGDPFDKDNRPDPAGTLTVNGKRYEIPEQENKPKFELKLPVKFAEGDQVVLELKDIDADGKSEPIGKATGKYSTKSPLWLDGSWFIAQVLTLEQASKDSDFVVEASKKHAKARLREWKKAKTLFSRGHEMIFPDCRLRNASVSRIEKYVNPRQTNDYPEKYLSRKGTRCYEICFMQKNTTNLIASSAGGQWFIGGVEVKVMDLLGNAMEADSDMHAYKWRRWAHNYTSDKIMTGQWGKICIYRDIPLGAKLGEIYLEAWAKLGETRKSYRLKLF